MTANQFYVPRVDTAGGKVFLTGAEHRHLTRTARVREGDEVILFDSSGARYRTVKAALAALFPAGHYLNH